MSPLDVGICMGFIYVAFLVCVIGTGVRIAQLLRTPLNLRWELYPVPHEKGYLAVRDEVPTLRGSGFAQFYHGGLAEELKETLKEMIFLVRVWKGKRKIWFFSFAMHDGMYLILLWFGALFIAAITQLAGIPVAPYSPNLWGAFLGWIVTGAGLIGAFAVAIATVGLFVFRWVDSGMRQYATFRDYFNLAFLFAVIITALVAVCKVAVDGLLATNFNILQTVYYLYDHAFKYAVLQMEALITFNPSLISKLEFVTSPLMLAHQILFGIFLIYYPFSKMVHGPAKYVSFHYVNWEDKPYQEGPLEYNYWGVIKIRER
ncbi:MAG: hypothetical protein GXO23_07525 [Crenarchaeota archaeon]|nr:hypothetical protein [Thermoproteota archaeon]